MNSGNSHHDFLINLQSASQAAQHQQQHHNFISFSSHPNHHPLHHSSAAAVNEDEEEDLLQGADDEDLIQHILTTSAQENDIINDNQKRFCLSAKNRQLAHQQSPHQLHQQHLLLSSTASSSGGSDLFANPFQKPALPLSATVKQPPLPHQHHHHRHQQSHPLQQQPLQYNNSPTPFSTPTIVATSSKPLPYQQHHPDIATSRLSTSQPQQQLQAHGGSNFLSSSSPTPAVSQNQQHSFASAAEQQQQNQVQMQTTQNYSFHDEGFHSPSFQSTSIDSFHPLHGAMTASPHAAGAVDPKHIQQPPHSYAQQQHLFNNGGGTMGSMRQQHLIASGQMQQQQHNHHRYAEWHADHFRQQVSPMPWRKESLPAMAFAQYDSRPPPPIYEGHASYGSAAHQQAAAAAVTNNRSEQQLTSVVASLPVGVPTNYHHQQQQNQHVLQQQPSGAQQNYVEQQQQQFSIEQTLSLEYHQQQFLHEQHQQQQQQQLIPRRKREDSFFEALTPERDDLLVSEDSISEIMVEHDALMLNDAPPPPSHLPPPPTFCLSVSETQAIDIRRTKSTALPQASCSLPVQQQKCSIAASWQPSSLNRFRSQLRTPDPGGDDSESAAALAPMFPFSLKPYTPPPMLSPMRPGTGLFCSLMKTRKQSAFDQQQQKSNTNNNNNSEVSSAADFHMVVGSDSNGIINPHETVPTPNDTTNIATSHVEKFEVTNDDDASFGGMRIKQEAASVAELYSPFSSAQNGGGLSSAAESDDHQDFPMHHGGDCGSSGGSEARPLRKNGLLFSDGGFAAELEALRKQSSNSGAAHRATLMAGHKPSITGGRTAGFHGHKFSMGMNDDVILRKMSSVSMDDEDKKDSGCVLIDIESVPKSDPNPHINLGKAHQARVKKWSDREISLQEREAIADRDEVIFSSMTIEHIPQMALAAYEALACSIAMPRPGRNKELALHILMENKGNLQAAVMDLLRADILDWAEQYPIIFNSLYTDVDNWSSEEILCFQDAIYKSEKDFHQVSIELNRPVKECVAFYYTWKKMCPDDYRKLRNLRRKRQLLEQQLDFSTIFHPTPSRSENADSNEDVSETESDATTNAEMDCFPSQDWSGRMLHTSLHLNTNNLAEHSSLPSTSSSLTTDHLKMNGTDLQCPNNDQFGYPWLHGENRIFPSPNSLNTTSAGQQHARYGGIGVNNNSVSALGEARDVGKQLEAAESLSFLHKMHRVHGSAVKKGAQPSTDGFFHCRLCEKKFEKVKSLNAHMKSHAMKARAEAETQLQQQSLQKTLSGGQPSELAAFQPFKPATIKPELVVNGAVTSPNSAGLGGVSPLNLSNSAVAAAAALNRLQNRQHFAALSAQPNLLLRNMLQQHVYGGTTEWLSNPSNQFSLPGSQ